MDVNLEIWKPVPDWEDRYEISNFGRVRNIETGKLKAFDINNYGYKRLQCYRDGKQKKYFVHILVAKLFVPGYKPGYVVNHIDGDKTNNHWTNLEWVTKTRNGKHAFELGLKVKKRSKITVKVVYSDGKECMFDSIAEFSRSVGICDKRIHHLFKTQQGYIPELNARVIKVSEHIY